MTVTVVRGFAGIPHQAFTAKEGGMIAYIKGYLKEQVCYSEALVMGACSAYAEQLSLAEAILFSVNKVLDETLHYAESFIITNS
jgi:hypothetical protein